MNPASVAARSRSLGSLPGQLSRMNLAARNARSRRLAGLRGQLAIVAATVFFSSLSFDLYNGTLPIYLFHYRGYSLELVSLLVGLASVTQLVGALVAGPFIDSRGARLVLRLGPCLYLPAAALFAASQDPLLLGLARVLQAVGFVLVLPAAYSLLPGMVSIRRRATALGVVGMANTVALAIGSPLGLWLLGRAPAVLFGCAALSALLALGTGSLLVVGVPASIGSMVFRLRASWVPFLLASFLAFVNWGVLLAFLPLEVPISRASEVGWFLAADAIALTVLRIPAGMANDRFGGRRMALAGVGFSLAALAVLLHSRSLAGLVVAGVGTGVAAALLLPAVQLELSIRSREGERGMAMALCTASFALAVSVGILGGGAVIAVIGFNGALWLSAALCASACLPLLLARVASPFGRVGAVERDLAGLTPAEAMVAAAWSEVLGVEAVGSQDAFLDLGGQSLQAIQIASRLSETFDVEIPLIHVFEHPTVAGSAAAIEALLAVPDHEQARRVVGAPPGTEAPASFAQERMWFLEQLDPGSAAYNVPYALRFTGELDVTALELSLNRVIARQEALRTRFDTSGGDVLQVILPAQPQRLGLLDLSDRPLAAAEAAAGEVMADLARRPFDLAAGPLHRECLIRLAEREHILMLTLHHSVCDEWSRRVLYRELAEGYVRREPAGAESGGPTVRYRDYASWQRDSVRQPRHIELLHDWSARLEGAPRSISLPLDHPRPAERTYSGAETSLQLSREQEAGLQELSRRNDVTPFMTHLALFATLLQRHSGENDILVGSPVANRSLGETEELVGCFVNTLVLRLRLDQDPTFDQLLRRVRATCLDAYARSELPFEMLVEELRPERDMSRTPLFQVMFDMESIPPAEGFPEALDVRPVPVQTGTSLFDLSLTVAQRPDGTTAVFEYSTDLFERSSIERMAARLGRLIRSVIEAPHLRLSELELLPESELARLRDFSQGPRRPAGLAVHRRVELLAGQQPQAPAIDHGGGETTYAELNRQANRLARHLIGCGAGPGRVVAVCLDRSPEFVTAVLAAHKAASAYVPLDPAYPMARLAALLDDTRPAVIVTESRFLDRLPSSLGRMVCLDRDREALSRLPGTDLAFEPGPGDLAYVIHTSGSTGRPKGVMVTQGALANWAEAAGQVYGLRPADRVLQFHSIGFDASVGDIFTTLAAGATLVMAPEVVRSSPAALLEHLVRLRPTVADLPTAYWHQLVDELEGRPALPVGLRLVIIGGESALPEKLRRWQRFVDPRIRLANSYGPTESTVVATVWWLHAGFGDRPSATVPIGRPVHNVSAHVLDETLQPCPIGVPGELLLGGSQLAAGYLNMAQETDRRFLVCDPRASGRPERLYRTGDRARWLPDGNLEFLGRLDRQVKVRGVRIELGEIEAALALHPSVAEAVVGAHERVAGDTQLVAYVVPRPRMRLAVEDVRAYLEQRLPAHEVPSAVVSLERLPMTASGKVDREALPRPSEILAARPAAGLTSPLESMLAAIWSEVLSLDRVGAADNFFELGGHSLLAARLAARMRRELGVDVSIRAIFETPTVAGLARRLESASHGPAAARLVLEPS